MTLGVGQPDSEDMAAYQASHDRGLASALSDTIHSSDALSVTRGDDVLTEIATINDYMRSLGTPYPTPWNPDRPAPTVAALRSNINQGYNAAAQPGSPPGYGPMNAAPYREVNAGGMTYTEALNADVPVLTDNLGSLRGGSYQEPAHELRPGFGRVDADDVLVVVFIALGAYGGYKLAEDKNFPTKAMATAGGALSAWVVAALVSLGMM